MSAELLRRAATILRERAEAATPGPWHQHHSDTWGPQSFVFSADGDHPGAIRGGCEGTYRGPENALYIATMHPGVGLALADWLELVASTPNFDSWLRSALRGATADGARQAMFLARLIVGAS